MGEKMKMLSHKEEKIVKKLWGMECIIVNNDKYCFKDLCIDKGFSSSFHCHHEKDETFTVIDGLVMLEIGDYEGVTGAYLMFEKGQYRVKPGVFHRFTGIRDSIISEVSTHHDDNDVERKAESYKRHVVYVDIDGILCTNESGNYKKAKPNYDAIKKVNKRYDEGEIIVLWTARGATTDINWYDLTVKQLKKWGVKFHDLSFNKPQYDEIWDDKCGMML